MRYKKLFIVGMVLLLVRLSSHAQLNLSGKTGLINIPTADQNRDGDFEFAYAYNPKSYGIKYRGEHPEAIFAANLTILPRLDINLNLLRPIRKSDYKREGIGDRQMEIKYLLIKETEKVPAVALILAAPFSIDYSIMTNAVVATKNLKLTEELSLGITAGYASPFYLFRDESEKTNFNIFNAIKIADKRDQSYRYLSGALGGLKIGYKEKAGAMLEWDSQHLNAGAYLKLFRFWTLQAGFVDMKQVSFGSSVRIPLKKEKKPTDSIISEK